MSFVPGMFPASVAFPDIYRARGIRFDTGQRINKGSELTGAADSKLWTGSFWFRQIASALKMIFSQSPTGSNDLVSRIYTDTTQAINIEGVIPDGGSMVLVIVSSAASIPINKWNHVMFSVDMANSANRHIYVNGTSDLTATTYTNSNIDFTRGDCYLGDRGDGGFGGFNGDIADFIMWEGTYVDLSVAANRALFRSSNGQPVNLSAAVSSIGTPIIRLDNKTIATWPTNNGGGGGFTVTGTLTNGGFVT